MKKYLCILVSIFPLLSFGAPFWNIPSSVSQPDGSVLNLFASGDEYANRLHDANGYTIIQSAVDGYYYYAILEKGEPVPSAYRYGTIDPSAYGLIPHINISREARQRKIDFMNAQKRRNERGPNIGNVNNLCIYIRFSDQTEFEIPRSVYNARFNEVGDNAVSLRSYFQKVSYNQLQFMTYHYPACADIINLSYQDTHPRSYYLPYNAVTNPNGYIDFDARTDREHSLLMNAVYAVASQVPASLNIDADNDGHVDNVCFIIRGPHSAWSDLLWAHRWVLFSYNVSIRNKRIQDYTFQPEDQNDVTTLCHEMFHSVGAPDLYHYEYDGLTPVGCWDIMESGEGHMCMFMKYFYGQNLEFYNYYRRKATYLDHKYFVRHQYDLKAKFQTNLHNFDENFTTANDDLVARIIANDLLEKYILFEIENIGTNKEKNCDCTSKLEWSSPKVNLIELIYALHQAKCFNNGNIELNEIIRHSEKFLNIDLSSFYKTLGEIKGRKINRTKFLHFLNNSLDAYFIEKDA